MAFDTILRISLAILNNLAASGVFERLRPKTCPHNAPLVMFMSVSSHSLDNPEILSILESITSNGKKLSAFFQMNLLPILQFLLDSIMIFECS